MPEATQFGEDTQRLAVSCFVHNALCGVDTEPVQEIVKVGHITPVHHAPDYVVGIMNLRGRVVTVIDLGMKLDLGATLVTPDSRILIITWQGEALGLLIDNVLGVVPVDRAEMKPPPENVRGVQSDMVEGVCQVDGRLMALLDLPSVLAVGDEHKRN
jgi:purine-binding chemotaxis protein CheW